MEKKSRLGRGYDALLMDNTSDEKSTVELRLTEIEPNAEQPRKQFDQAALDELSDNIKRYGLLQPIVVRPVINGNYQIVAGERRWRACRQAGLKTIPVIIKELSDEQTMEIALIENLQREDLNPIEEAEGYKQLMDTFGMTQDELSKRVGKSRSAIANALRLLDLGEYKTYVEQGVISAGHARAMLPLSDNNKAEALNMVRKGASVREIEKFVQQTKENGTDKKTTIDGTQKTHREFGKDPYLQEVQLALQEALGRKVTVSRTGAEKGTMQVEFYSEDDLKDLVIKMFGNNL